VTLGTVAATCQGRKNEEKENWAGDTSPSAFFPSGHGHHLHFITFMCY